MNFSIPKEYDFQGLNEYIYIFLCGRFNTFSNHVFLYGQKNINLQQTFFFKNWNILISYSKDRVRFIEYEEVT